MEVRDRRAEGGAIELREVPVAVPWTKDYDAYRGEGPMRWAGRWDLVSWRLFAAFDGAMHVGGAVVAYDTPGVDLLEGRRDLAVLWDLRVHPAHRRRGVARALLAAAKSWARERGCRELKVETQDVNVPACRLYTSVGFVLTDARTGAYPPLPDEVQLIFRRPLAP